MESGNASKAGGGVCTDAKACAGSGNLNPETSDRGGNLQHVADVAWAGEAQLRYEQELQQAKQAAAVARLEQERTQSLLDLVLAAAPVGMAFFDRELRYVRANRFMAIWQNSRPEDLIGKRLADALPAGAAEFVSLHLYRVMQTGLPVLGIEVNGSQFNGINKDPRHWLADFYPVWLPEGELLGVGAIVADITERKRDEEELIRQKNAAEAANRAKDQFLAVLSHELRTPLSPVLTTISAMAEDAGFNPEIRATLQMVRRNVEMEARLIDDLLDVTRITRGKLQLNMMRVDARLAIDNAVETCLSDIHDKQIALVVELEAGRPYVHGDPARLQQVVWNLLKNAVKFTPSHGKINIRCENDVQGWLKIEVRDSGIGIEPAVLPRIFAAFEQGEPGVTRRFGGLGLGLTISHALVEAHGGELLAASEGKNRGATFTVLLPTIDEPVLHDEFEVRPPDQPIKRSVHILLVEDHPDTLKAMKRLLQQAGHSVQSADCIAAAMEVVKREEFDLLISDIGLPDGNGLELLGRIREIKPLKAIALSGYGMEEDIRRSCDAGFQAHLTKPIDLNTLHAVISQLVS